MTARADDSAITYVCLPAGVLVRILPSPNPPCSSSDLARPTRQPPSPTGSPSYQPSSDADHPDSKRFDVTVLQA